MQNSIVRIVIDTNLWVSFLITKNFDKLDKLLFSKKIVLVFSEELLDEFLEVIQRPKFKKYFSNSDIRAVIDTIDEFADFIVVETTTIICRDIKDNFLLSLAKDGNADFLLTGDNDLLELKEFEGAKIMTISEFLNI
jgi:putative PIN family toxin of toxin-antitoxin system